MTKVIATAKAVIRQSMERSRAISLTGVDMVVRSSRLAHPANSTPGRPGRGQHEILDEDLPRNVPTRCTERKPDRGTPGGGPPRAPSTDGQCSSRQSAARTRPAP